MQTKLNNAKLDPRKKGSKKTVQMPLSFYSLPQTAGFSFIQTPSQSGMVLQKDEKATSFRGSTHQQQRQLQRQVGNEQRDP
jgi:hypothetical protein